MTYLFHVFVAYAAFVTMGVASLDTLMLKGTEGGTITALFQGQVQYFIGGKPFTIDNEDNPQMKATHFGNQSCTLVISFGKDSIINILTLTLNTSDGLYWQGMLLALNSSMGGVYHFNMSETSGRLAAADQAYVCNAAENFTANEPGVYLALSSLKVQVEGVNSADPKFSTSVAECSQDGTTSTAAPITTTTPTPSVGHWTVSVDGSTCLIMQATIALTLTYPNDKGTNETVSVTANSLTATVDNATSHCGNATIYGNDDDVLVLAIMAPISQGKLSVWNLTIDFSDKKIHTGDDDGNSWTMYKMKLDYFMADYHNGAVQTVYAWTNASTKVQQGSSYACTNKQTFTLTANETTAAPVHLDMTKAQWQAYIPKDHKGSFDTAHHCPADNVTNDLVPIIVGSCLAALVVIVLVAYLIGRARAKRSTGYESV